MVQVTIEVNRRSTVSHLDDGSVLTKLPLLHFFVRRSISSYLVIARTPSLRQVWNFCGLTNDRGSTAKYMFINASGVIRGSSNHAVHCLTSIATGLP